MQICCFACLNLLQYALHIQLADDCLDRYSQYRPFFVHIQLAADHAKIIIHCAVWRCSENR